MDCFQRGFTEIWQKECQVNSWELWGAWNVWVPFLVWWKLAHGDTAREGAWIRITMPDSFNNLSNSAWGCKVFLPKLLSDHVMVSGETQILFNFMVMPLICLLLPITKSFWVTHEPNSIESITHVVYPSDSKVW